MWGYVKHRAKFQNAASYGYQTDQHCSRVFVFTKPTFTAMVPVAEGYHYIG